MSYAFIISAILFISTFLYYRSKRPWHRYPLYITMVFLAYIIYATTNYIFSNLNFSLDNVSGSAKITISSLAVIETSVFVIVASFGSVAAQLVSMTYSMRVIHVYKSLKDHLIILFTYFGILIFNIYLLILIPSDVSQFQSTLYYDNFIWASVYLGVYAILILIIYCWNIFEMLNPSQVIANLLDNIKHESLLSIPNARKRNDLIQPIEDIIKISLKNHDFAAACMCITGLRDVIKEIMSSDKTDINDSNRIREYIQGRILEIGSYAAENSTIILRKLIKFNFLMTMLIIKRKTEFQQAEEIVRDIIIKRSIHFIESLGDVSIKSSNQYEAKLTSRYLGRLGNISSEISISDEATLEILRSLECIGIEALDNDMKEITQQSVNSLRLIGENFAEKNMQISGSSVTKSLKEIGKICIILNYPEKLQIVLDSLAAIGSKSSENGGENDIKIIIGSAIAFETLFIESIKNELYIKNNKSIIFESIHYLQSLLNTSLKNNKDSQAIERIVDSLETIRVNSDKFDNGKSCEKIKEIYSSTLDKYPQIESIKNALMSN